MKPGNLHTRRAFLHNCGIVTAGITLPQFLLQTAESVAAGAGWEAGSSAPLPGFKDDHILVVVQLSGGNDGLNTLVPYTDDNYFKARPRLALNGGQRIRVDDNLAMNNALAGLKGLYDDGKVAVIQGVGYPNPDRSHFRSMEIWHTASDSDRNEYSGWVGRYFDNCCEGTPAPTAGVYLGNELPQAFYGKRGTGVSFSSPEDFGYVAGKKGDDTRNFRAMNDTNGEKKNASLDFLRHVTDGAMVSQDKIHQISSKVKNTANYPMDSFTNSLATIARMIAGGLGSRIYYTSLGGFDTHTNQEGTHDRLLQRYSTGIAAFYADLKKLNESRRVVIMTFSEFGRRVEQNGSNGTDHGTAAPMFLIGDSIKGGVYGKAPSLTDLDQGDLKFTTDFRSVYATALKKWFDADPALVLGRNFETVPFFA